MTGAAPISFGPAPAIAVVPFFRAGDFILATGLFNAIKQRLPGAELPLAVQVHPIRALEGGPRIFRPRERDHFPHS